MGVVFALAMPQPLFALGVVVPSVLVLLTLSLLASSMVLTAATVSDGFLVFIFAIYTLFMTSLYTGKSFDKTGGSAVAYIIIPGLLVLSFREGAQTLGLELIKLMWTESGLTNPLAVNRNVLITVCWSLIAYIIAVILPPIRTARATLTRNLLPLIYKQIAAVLTGETNNYGVLIHFWNSLGQGSIAKLTLFEPRLFLSWTEDLVTPLTDMIVQTDHLLIASITVQKVKLVGQDGPEGAVMKENALLVNLCADALASNDAADLNAWDESVLPPEPEEKTTTLAIAYRFHTQVKSLRISVLAWLDALEHPTHADTSKGKIKQIGTTLLPWIVAPLLPTMKRLGEALLLPFRPKQWVLRPFLWCLKLTAGFVGLFCMTIYWDGYANFRLDSRENIGNVYYGWNLLGYAYAWRPTEEGTFKKGFQRALGTVLGAFVAWLGVIVCSWSYDDADPINPYGFIAWLTIATVVIAVFFTFDSGPMAMMGQGKDHGYTGMYFGMTMALIGLEVYAGSGSKNGLTVNRIVATLSGVAMAMVVALIPPTVRGSDPKHAQDYLTEIQKAFKLVLETFVDEKNETQFFDEKEGSKFNQKGFQDSVLASASENRRWAFYLLNDASMFQRLPIFKVSPKLKPLLEQMALVEALVGQLVQSLARLINAQQSDVEAARRGIEEILKDDEMISTEEELGDIKETEMSYDRIQLSLTLICSIRDELKELEVSMDGVTYSCM